MGVEVSGEQLAIYHGTERGRYVVKPWVGVEERLWCRLGPAYTRETARALADSLERDERRTPEGL